jgi:carboxypeptidase C (cathepsin A)
MRAAALCAITLAAMTAALPAQAKTDAYGIVTTHHRIVVNGKTLAYTARAGLIPVHDNETGDVHANVFFIAYTLDRSPTAGSRSPTWCSWIPWARDTAVP